MKTVILPHRVKSGLKFKRKLKSVQRFLKMLVSFCNERDQVKSMVSLDLMRDQSCQKSFLAKADVVEPIAMAHCLVSAED